MLPQWVADRGRCWMTKISYGLRVDLILPSWKYSHHRMEKIQRKAVPEFTNEADERIKMLVNFCIRKLVSEVVTYSLYLMKFWGTWSHSHLFPRMVDHLCRSQSISAFCHNVSWKQVLYEILLYKLMLEWHPQPLSNKTCITIPVFLTMTARWVHSNINQEPWIKTPSLFY